MTYKLGEVILEREFVTYDRDRKMKKVKLRVGKPQLLEQVEQGAQMWDCPRQIVGLGDEKVRHGYGIDGLQALWLSLQSAEAELEVFAKREHKLITWLDSNDLGLPKGESIAKNMPDFDDIFKEFLRREDGRD